MPSNNTTHFNILCHIYMHTLKHQIRSIKLQRYIHRITNYRPFLSLCAFQSSSHLCIYLGILCLHLHVVFFRGLWGINHLIICLPHASAGIYRPFIFYLGEISAVTRRWSISGAPSPSLMIMWCETEHHCDHWLPKSLDPPQRNGLSQDVVACLWLHSRKIG